MKRFHVHVAVNDIAASVAFYSQLFGQEPAKKQLDYAKWMLEDPRLNFAISSRGHAAGVNHFGMQADSAEELSQLRALLDAASGGATWDQGEAACCYARSEKQWVLDPQGLAWEYFMTMADSSTFGDSGPTETGACCIPLRKSDQDAGHGSCCVPQEGVAGQQPCCKEGPT